MSPTFYLWLGFAAAAMSLQFCDAQPPTSSPARSPSTCYNCISEVQARWVDPKAYASAWAAPKADLCIKPDDKTAMKNCKPASVCAYIYYNGTSYGKHVKHPAVAIQETRKVERRCVLPTQVCLKSGCTLSLMTTNLTAVNGDSYKVERFYTCYCDTASNCNKDVGFNVGIPRLVPFNHSSRLKAVSAVVSLVMILNFVVN